jgi:hypothetical protein
MSIRFVLWFMFVPVIPVLFWLAASVPAHADYSVDCDDFSSSEAAQRYLERHPGDPAGLDRDGDGYACDFGPPGTDRAPGPKERSDDEGGGVPYGQIVGGALLIGVPAWVAWGWIDGRPERRETAKRVGEGTYHRMKHVAVWVCDNGVPYVLGQLVAWELRGDTWWGLVELQDGPNRAHQRWFPQEQLKYPGQEG